MAINRAYRERFPLSASNESSGDEPGEENSGSSPGEDQAAAKSQASADDEVSTEHQAGAGGPAAFPAADVDAGSEHIGDSTVEPADVRRAIEDATEAR